MPNYNIDFNTIINLLGLAKFSSDQLNEIIAEARQMLLVHNLPEMIYAEQRLIWHGFKVEALKSYRERTGESLLNSKCKCDLYPTNPESSRF